MIVLRTSGPQATILVKFEWVENGTWDIWASGMYVFALMNDSPAWDGGLKV